MSAYLRGPPLGETLHASLRHPESERFTGEEMTEPAVDRVLKLEQEFEAARNEAITQLLQRRKETEEQLKVLGHEGKPAKAKKSRPCSKCNATDHDARFHRGDEKRKAAGA
jgi:hypothetical protein